MNVALTTSSFPRFEGDIPGAFVLGYAKMLVDAGHDVHVYAPEPRDAAPPPAWPGITLHWVPYLRPQRWQGAFYGAGVTENLRRNPLAVLGASAYPVQLRRALATRARGADAIVSHWAFPLAFAWPDRSHGVPHLAIFHAGDLRLLEVLPRPVSRLLARQLAARVTALGFVSHDLRERFLMLLPPRARAEVLERSLVAPMGVDVPRDLPARKVARERLAFTAPTVVGMARFVPVKRLERLIAAAPLLGESGIDVVLVGEGPLQKDLETLARRVAPRVRFLGPLHGPAKWDALLAADVFACVSDDHLAERTEGTPVTVLEAVAVGTPVVTTDAGGLRDHLVHGRDAWFVDGTPEDLVRAVRNVIDRTPTRPETPVAPSRFTWEPHLGFVRRWLTSAARTRADDEMRGHWGRGATSSWAFGTSEGDQTR